MESDVIKEQLKVLKAANGKDKTTCDYAINVLNDYFDVPRKPGEIKYAIDLMFKETDSKLDVHKFFTKSIQEKELHKSATDLLELIMKLTELFPINIQFYSDYIITKCCIPIVRATTPSARFKEISVKVITKIVTTKALDEETNIELLIRDIMSIFDQKMKNKLFCATYELLGILSKTHNESFQPHVVAKLRNSMVSNIQNLFKDDKAGVSLQLVGGVVNSLKNLLENFTPTFEEDPDFLDKLYESMERLSDVDESPNLNTDHNRIAFRNMLEIIHLYGHLVGEKFFENYKRWERVLAKWISSKSYDDRVKGVNAAQTFYIEVGKAMVAREDPADKPILMRFMGSFKETLLSSSSQPHEIRIAIRGFGAMAEACKILMGSAQLNEYFDLIMQRAEHSSFKGEERRDNFQNLPNYIESLSELMNQLSEISSTQAQSLESVIVTLMKDFHFLSVSHHEVTVMCLLKTFSNIERAGDKIFEDIINSIVWQGVLWSCRHQLIYDIESTIETMKDWRDLITYRKYLPLWSRLLADRDEKYSHITRILYASFVKNLFGIIHLLDLSMKKRKYSTDTSEVEFYFTDPSLDLEPVRSENFQILYNLVQFYSDIIAQQSIEKLKLFFAEWLEFWIENSIQLALKHPTISAFLYLVEVALVTIAKMDYSADEVNEIKQLKFFLKFLFSRCEHMSGEYQVAILRLIFQSPAVLLKEHYVEEISAVYCTGFTIGKNILTIAHYALSSFEKLIDCLNDDPKTKRTMLEAVLPFMEAFLSNDDLQPVQNEVRQLKVGRFRRRQMIFAVETDLMRIKKRIILFLGRCSPDEAQLFLAKCEQKLVRHNYLADVFSVKLECNDQFSPIIYLDQIMERVKALAISSSDRSVRITACELLHGLVLYFIGKNLERDETIPMWKELCCDLILLGADEDLTVRQLYEPLLMQMMHYFSQPSKILSKLSSTLIESLMVMISHKNNCVQDLSARLLREFNVWLFRQTSRNERENSPVRLLDTFQELKKMSIETNQFRRIGAALAFNNIYSIIKDEDALVDVYWIYLFDVFCSNFKSSEDFSDALDCFFVDERRFQQISTCLDNILNDFITRKYIFEQPSKDRIRPIGFTGILYIDIIHWLLLQCSVEEFFYRQKCMNMFMKMLTESETNAENYYEKYLSVEKIVEIGEGNGIPNQPREHNEPIFKEVYKWMKKVLSSLDFYTWALENQLMPANEINRFLGQTTIMRVVQEFFSKDIIRSIDADSTQASYEMKMNNRNLEKIDIMRCVIFIKILDFLSALMRQNEQPQEIFVENQADTLKIVTKLVFKPQRLGFDYRTYNVIKDLDTRLAKFITACHSSSSNFSNVLVRKLQDKVFKYLDYFIQNCRKILTSRTVNDLDKSKLKGISFLIARLRSPLVTSSVDWSDKINKKIEVLFQKLFDEIVEEIDGEKCPLRMSPSVSLLATKMLQTCLKFQTIQLRTIARFCFDPTKLKRNSQEKLFKGEHFMQTYKTTILEFYLADIEQSVNLFISMLSDAKGKTSSELRVINILSEINTHIYKSHHADKNLLQKNFQAQVNGWTYVREGILKMEHENKNSTLINYLTNLAMVCPYELHMIDQRLAGLKDWIFSLLNDKKLTLKIKTKAIQLLPCVTNIDDVNNEELDEALQSVQKVHFPLRSHEFTKESLERAIFLDAVRAIFQCLVLSKSPIVFNFIINFTVQDDDFLLEKHLQEALTVYMDRLTEKQQENILNKAFDIFINANYEPEIRLNVVTRYILNLIKNAHIDTILTFFRNRISQIVNILNSRFDMHMEIELINSTGAFIIIEAFFSSVPKEKIEASTFSFDGNLNDGKALTKNLMLKARDVRSKPLLSDDPNRKELHRKYQCYAYRALISIVVNNTSVEKPLPKIFDLSLFEESPEKNKWIWEKLINTEDEDLYAFTSQDFETFPKIKEYIVSIKDLKPDQSVGKKKYLQTTSIFDHTLSQTLTKSDLTYSVVLSTQNIAKQNEVHQANMKVQIESIPINNHEVMSHLIGVVQYIYSMKISPFHAYEKHHVDKYKWAVSIANSLRHHQQHKNVKIFLAKLIENCRVIFSHYAKIFTGPILSILTDGTLGDKMNFFITDLTAMLISWGAIYKPSDMQEKEEGGRLFNFLLANAYHDRSEIFKLNLELLKKLIETWRFLEDKISFATLTELLENQERLSYGLQLNAVVLSNEIAPWENQEQCQRYVNLIMRAFRSAESKLYQSSAQLLGMVLHLISSDETMKGVMDSVMERLRKIEGDRSKSEMLLEILYGIHKSYPAILDSFMSRIINSIQLAVRKTKSAYLEMFLSRLEILDGRELFRYMINIKIAKLLKQKEYQVVCLHIINKACDILVSKEFMRFFDDIIYLLSSPSTEVRRIIYEIMIFAVEKYKDNFPEKQRVMTVILKGFSEADDQIQNRVVNFLNTSGFFGLSDSYSKRFQELLTNYFDPSFEKEFLNYATQLLLDISVRHPRSTRPLLTYDERNNSNFFEFPIATKTFSQKSLPPAFVSSQRKQLIAGEGSQAMMLLQATASVANDTTRFTPTLDPQSFRQVPENFTLQHVQNSLLVSLKPQLLDLRSRPSQGAEDNRSEDERIIMNKNATPSVDSSLDYLRRRIVNTTQDERSRNYAMRAIERREFRDTKQREKISQMREGKEVVIYRRYRYGDFPDFFFNTLAILLPLQALVKKDSSIARDVFITIFDSIVKTFIESNDDDGEKLFYDTINKSVTVVMENTKQSFSYLLSALIEMTIRSEKYLQIKPESLGNILPVHGILFLESQLVHLNKDDQMELSQYSEESQGPSKRQRIDFDDVKLQHWMKLIEYNYKMREFEVINGIFVEKLKLKSDVKISVLRALDSETSGSYKEAMSIYENLLRAQAFQNDTEKDFFYNSYFNCLANLSDWESTIPEVQKQLDDYGEIWEKKIPFYKNTILPQLMKGELRKTLTNQDNEGFLQVLEDWMDDDKKRAELLLKFPEIIAMFFINMENYTACSNQLEETFRDEINAWSSMEMLEDKMSQLLKVRTLAEIYNFAELATSPDPKEKIQKMFSDWKLTTPTATDSIIYWNDLIAYRREFTRLSAFGKVEIDTRSKAQSSLVDVECGLLNVAFAQKNTDAARHLIDKFKKQEQRSNENVLKCNLSIGRYEMIIAENKMTKNFSEALTLYGRAWMKLYRGVLNHDAIDDFKELKVDFYCCIGEIADRLATVYQKIDQDAIPEDLHAGFRGLMDIESSDVNMANEFLRCSEKSLKDARELAKQYLNDDFSVERELLLGNVYFKLGQFYRRVFANEINKESRTQLEIVKAIFRAISLGCDEARLYIPYILVLPDLLNNNLTKDFNDQLNLVPEWMFISHISQILSNFDFVNESYLDDLIMKMATKYPNALYFPFKLSYENHQNSNQSGEKSSIKIINELLSKDVYQKFMTSLQCLVLPEKLIDTHLHNFGQKLTENIDNEIYQKAAKTLFENIFTSNATFRGNDFARIAREFKDKIQKFQFMNWNFKKEEIKNLWRSLQSSIDRMLHKITKDHVDLKNLCGWLDNYKWSGDNDFIEIPGQYGDSKPFIESHVKIVRFEQRLKVFSSKQKPVELKILGSDGKIYSFIMKYGEDVRQDQRIQQVLQLMSKKFSLDKRCKENRLAIVTYQVIPINSYCGMLQMVTDALTINDFMIEISKSLLTETFDGINFIIRREFHDFLHQNEHFVSWQKTYESAILRTNRQTLADKFTEFEQRIPSDIISRALRSIANTLESFYVLRKNFITSMAAMNIAHWLLGIGDRHLNNIMIDVRNGSLIGIDFGIAFGTAAILQVPELVPFRLTSHFVDVLEPLGIEGMIKKNMQYALKCLRTHSEIILICLEVFVKEPSLDWLMQSKKSEIANENQESIWDPANRIDIVKRKLDGVNPTKVLIEELSSGFIKDNKPLLEAYKDMIKNATGESKRQVSDDLTPEEQVTCLVKLATDKSILATTYIGWNGWF